MGLVLSSWNFFSLRQLSSIQTTKEWSSFLVFTQSVSQGIRRKWLHQCTCILIRWGWSFSLNFLVWQYRFTFKHKLAHRHTLMIQKLATFYPRTWNTFEKHLIAQFITVVCTVLSLPMCYHTNEKYWGLFSIPPSSQIWHCTLKVLFKIWKKLQSK